MPPSSNWWHASREDWQIKFWKLCKENKGKKPYYAGLEKKNPGLTNQLNVQSKKVKLLYTPLYKANW